MTPAVLASMGVSSSPRAVAARASSASSASTSSSATSVDASSTRRGKRLYLVRHGRTEMNDYLRYHDWSSPHFEDPMKYDTALTSEGEAQARALGERVRSTLDPPPEVLIASPLSRAMHTAELAFADAFPEIPRETCVLARERVFHASDVGSHPAVLRERFPSWRTRDLDDAVASDGDDGWVPWWYHGGTSDPKHVAPEPIEVFEKRMHDLIAWIDAREETTIAMVAHWGTWYSLTGREFENCELVACALEDLRPGRGAMK